MQIAYKKMSLNKGSPVEQKTAQQWYGVVGVVQRGEHFAQRAQDKLLFCSEYLFPEWQLLLFILNRRRLRVFHSSAGEQGRLIAP